jgi:ketosteroid isomerase-like protein
VSLLPSTKPIMGKPAIAKFFGEVMAQLKDARMQKFEMQCFDIVVSGDWASEWCTEHQVVDLGPGKPPFDGWGKMLLVLHKTGGSWRLAREMWNQAVPGDAH